MSESTNEFLYMDSDHYVWIASLDGVNLFDGKGVRVFKTNPNDPYSLKGIDVQSPFFEDELGNIWFTTGEGINVYDKGTGRFKTDFASGKQDSTSGHYAFHLENNRFLWVVAAYKLYRYDTRGIDSQSRIPVLNNFEIARAAVDTNEVGEAEFVYGSYWNNNQGFEVYSIKSKERSIWFREIGSPADFMLRVTHIIPNIGEETCFLTNKGLLFFNPKNPQNFRVDPFPDDFGLATHFEKFGNQLWLINRGAAIRLYDLVEKRYLNHRIVAFNLDEKLPIEGRKRIFFGRDSTLWLTVGEKGVYYANLRNRRTFSAFQYNELPENAIHRIYELENGAITCISKRGRGWLFNQQKEWQRSFDLPRNYHQVELENGEVWAASVKGIGKLNKNQRVSKWFNFPQANTILFDLVALEDSILLLGTNHGVLAFNTITHNCNTIDGYPKGNFAVNLLVDKHKRLWTANAADQLTIWKLSQEGPISLERQKAFFNMGIMNHMVEDPLRSKIWLATSKGLVNIGINKFDRGVLTEADGLPNQYIRSVVLDRNNKLWLATNKGIVRYLPEAKHVDRFRHFVTRDGLSAEVYSAGALLLANSGDLWFGSTKGVDVLGPDSDFVTYGKAPKLAIKEMMVHNQLLSMGAKIKSGEEIVLPYWENSLTFKIAALEYTDPARNTFEVFQISEGDTTKISSTENTFSFPFLSPGNYHFEFTARNAEGVWQKEPFVLPIRIKPPFYQTLWFRMLLLLFLLFLAGLVSSFYYRYQLRAKQLELEKQKRLAALQKQKLEKRLALQAERDRIAGELHDELGGGLSTIRNASARAAHKSNPDELKGIVVRISQISLGLIRSMRELIWAMNPENDSLGDLVAKVRLHTAEFLSDNSIQRTINTPEIIPAVTITSQVRHHIYLTVKEILHNIVKHADATEVKFDLSITDSLYISIKDNGKGFDIASKEGFGIRNTRNRMQAINGTIEWYQLQEGGTEVQIRLRKENLV